MGGYDTLALISVIAGVISSIADSLTGVPFTLFECLDSFGCPIARFECLDYFSLLYFTIFSQPYLDMGLFGGYVILSFFFAI